MALVAPPWRYRLLLRLAAPLLWVHLLMRSARDGGWRYLCERLGVDQPEFARLLVKQTGARDAAPHGCRWIHAASVGEVLTVLPLLEALQRLEPDAPVLVTTTTPTGAAILEQRTSPTVHHRYLPIDWPGACRRFLRRTRPISAWVVETEIWPWLYAFCQHEKLGPCIINARLSPRTMRSPASWLHPSYRQALADANILARSETDARRYLALGAGPERVCVAGNLKFAGSSSRPAARQPIALPCCVAASTHDDEELQLAEHWLRQPRGLLVIAPRHPERGTRVHAALEAACRQAGAPACARRSRDELPRTGDRLYLADTLGELPSWFDLATAVFMGGSLIPRGGHNLLEPARHGCPIVTGPHTDNFSDVVELLNAHSALLCVDDAGNAVTQLQYLMENPPLAAAMGQRALAVVEQQAGVVDDYLRLLLPEVGNA